MNLNSSSGCTAEEFISKPKPSGKSDAEPRSRYDLLREHIARNLGVPVENVDIFTVRDHPSIPRTIDVRYSAHGSPFYQPVKLDGRLANEKNAVRYSCSCVQGWLLLLIATTTTTSITNNTTAAAAVDATTTTLVLLCWFCEWLWELFSFLRSFLFCQLEKLLGLDLAMTPVDECLEEVCDSAGCTSVLVIADEPLIVNANQTSIVGVTSYVERKCTCGARDFSSSSDDVRCHVGSCFNGGTCHQLDHGFR